MPPQPSPEFAVHSIPLGLRFDMETERLSKSNERGQTSICLERSQSTCSERGDDDDAFHQSK